MYSRFPPPSPPWGLQTQRSVAMNVSFNLRPLSVVSTNAPAGVGGLNQLLCHVTPTTSGAWTSQRNARLRDRRQLTVRKKRQVAVGKLINISNQKLKSLKRLRRGPLLKMKKQEVFDKWEKKRKRSYFRLRHRMRKRVQTCNELCQLNTLFAANCANSFLGNSSVSSSPIPCRLWNCDRVRRKRFRSDSEPEVDDRNSSKASDGRRSRSPIIIRPE